MIFLLENLPKIEKERRKPSNVDVKDSAEFSLSQKKAKSYKIYQSINQSINQQFM